MTDDWRLIFHRQSSPVPFCGSPYLDRNIIMPLLNFTFTSHVFFLANSLPLSPSPTVIRITFIFSSRTAKFAITRVLLYICMKTLARNTSHLGLYSESYPYSTRSEFVLKPLQPAYNSY